MIQPPILPISQPAPHIPQPPHHDVSPNPQLAAAHGSPRIRPHSSSSAGSTVSITSTDSGSGSISSSPASEGRNDAAHTIEISPAFYDDSHVEGPATGFPTSERFSRPSLNSQIRISEAEFTPTVSFIHPYDPLYYDDFDGARELSPEQGQGVEPFDFDLLPKRGYTFPSQDGAVSAATVETPLKVEKDGEDISELRNPKDILRRVQHRCNKQDPSINPPPPSRSINARSLSPRRPVDPAARFKMINAVPLLTAPLTRVLSPVITRGQWEIVVKSAAIAALMSWTIIGCLVAIPVTQ
jgi:hypothetical protein